MKTFENKVVLITGGTSGIGRAAAVAFAKQGAKVVVSGRRVPEGDETVRRIKAAGGEGLFVQTDVTQVAQVKALVDQTVAKFGRLDVAFNNAGVEGTLAPIVEETEANYDLIFDANVKGVLFAMKYQIPAILKSGGGSIINNASVLGLVGTANFATYVASKHAVIGLTRSAALENAKLGVRINAVGPAVIQTEMYERAFATDEAKSFAAGLHPIGRIGQADEIAAAVLFLASPGASFIVGQTLAIDGGMTAQ
jgi:NAD(P)-dependent dehydrogenase (short-subunit alcohol dehydrogenase family)